MYHSRQHAEIGDDLIPVWVTYKINKPDYDVGPTEHWAEIVDFDCDQEHRDAVEEWIVTNTLYLEDRLLDEWRNN